MGLTPYNIPLIMTSSIIIMSMATIDVSLTSKG